MHIMLNFHIHSFDRTREMGVGLRDFRNRLHECCVMDHILWYFQIKTHRNPNLLFFKFFFHYSYFYIKGQLLGINVKQFK